MKHRIVILGAGYAGATAAGRLARRLHPGDTEITVVNADADFVERVRLHQLATGQHLRRRELSEIFAGTGVRVRVAHVAAVDPDARTVTLDDGEIGYDTLVYALGSAAAGVPEHAYNVSGRDAALRLRDRLATLSSGGTVLVAGGGLTGLEAVTEIAEAHPGLAVALATRGALGDWLDEKARRHLRGVLERLGVTVHEHTDVVRVETAVAGTSEGRLLPADVTVWAAGFAVHPLAAATTLRVAGTGQIAVDKMMRSFSHPDVYAVGDAAIADGPGGRPLRMACASAVPMAWRAADDIVGRLTGRRVRKTPLRYVNQCISLGRGDGIIQFVTADDRATPSLITGRTAARFKEIVCRGAAWEVAHPTLAMPSRRRRLAPAHADSRTASPVSR
ncbi:NAD(P)/FAD-dependent oxidoreductase [Mangrovihabitans endophyticus]|uniref:Oxidoreductase n=1 Tax=Mangrovihabitans endophyticus TaxID=1751298 RepID=A0A8J3FLM5_9ACTN|nr:FAD-dependent oxidoreductase [Mangrovihabitans endophyticus]GGK78342.1 oxidoreductase [Mangrovihabitans endophyticus]